MKIKNTTRGFTLVEIMIVVAIIGLLAAIAIPNFVKARQVSQRNTCIANMKQITGAKLTWALEQRKTISDTPSSADLFGATKYILNQPKCPSGTDPYPMTAVDQPQSCPNIAAVTDHVPLFW